MRLYIVSLFDPSGLRERVIKVFSTKENLDRWMECAKLMDYELFGNRGYDITKDYRVNEADLDNLDFVELLAESKHLGANVKPPYQP